MTSAQSNRRYFRNLLLNPAYQLKYVFWLGLTGLLLTAINCTIFYIFTRENYSILVDLAPMTDEVKTQLYQELYQIIGYMGLFSLAFLILVCFLGLALSHRTAGPLYHFKRVFESIKNGKHEARVHLRPKDDFKDVAQAFNEMMDKLPLK